jgi:ankyrin repeat protein
MKNNKGISSNQASIARLRTFILNWQLADLIAFLSKHTIDLNAVTDSHGWTLLHLAVDKQRVSIVEYLLNVGADTLRVDTEGRIPIHLAVDNGNRQIVEHLLTKTTRINALAQANQKNKQGETAVYLAARRGDLLMVQLFLNKNIAFPWLTEANRMLLKLAVSDQYPKIQYALKMDSTAFAKAILTSGEAFSTYLLYLGVRAGDTAFVKQLIHLSIDVNILDKNTYIRSIQHGYVDIINILLQQNVRLTWLSASAQGLLKLAVSDQYPKIQAALKTDSTAFEKAILTGGEAFSNYLLYLGVRVGDTAFVKQLIHLGIDVNVSQGDGKVPLHVAAQVYNISMIDTLVEAGADLNKRAADGCNAVGFALSGVPTCKVIPVVRHLIEAGVDLPACEKSSVRPLSNGIVHNMRSSHVAMINAQAQKIGLSSTNFFATRMGMPYTPPLFNYRCEA